MMGCWRMGAMFGRILNGFGSNDKSWSPILVLKIVLSKVLWWPLWRVSIIAQYFSKSATKH
jgi:hypothetical protein